MGRNPGACRSYAEVAVGGIPVCQQHADSTLECRRLAGLESPCVTVHDTGFCQYERVYASWNPAALRQLAESAGEVWVHRVELRPALRNDLAPSVWFMIPAESAAAALATLRIPPGWTAYVNRVRRVSRV